jgi:Legume lectin domain/Chitobiase/beta-hexosaminidase C-terminal domain
MVVPTQTTGNYPNLLVQTGKAGNTVLLNRDNLGGYNATDNVVQETDLIASFGTWSSPAYWNGTVYYAGQLDNLIASPLANGQLSTTPTRSSETYAWPGATPAISANGSTQGIVWTIDSSAYSTSGPAVLAAHNASNVATTLYSSNTNLSRDNPGPAVKFTPPTIVNGKVYVATANQLSVYGLLAGVQQAATPVLTPGTESFNGSVSVSITDSTPGATIYYTTNGTTPTASSTQYTGAITVSATTTINAVASASDYLVSQMASATYTNITQASAPTFSVVGGAYSTAQSVSISDATAGATIYYTTNGTTPTTSSTQYTGAAISVSTTETLEAMAVAAGYANSAVASAAYTIQPLGISFPQGFANSEGLMILNGSTDLDDSRLQLTDGGLSEGGTAWYATPMNVQSFTTTFTFQLSNPAANGITFTIQNQGTAALGMFGLGLGYEYIPTSVAVKFDLYNAAGEGPDSTGLYTDGAVPTVPAIDLSSTGINLHSDDTMSVQLVYNGTTLAMTITDTVTLATFSTSWAINIPATVGGNTAYVGFTGGTGALTASQKILTWTYTPGAALPTPTFSVAAGTYTTAQTVSISDSSSGATIYYTTNGTTPTTSSTKYAGTAISVSSTETIKAMAVATGYTNSAVATAAYTIASVLPTPTFSVAAGTYTTAQTVSISDSSSGATIYYTTNGTTPTTSSTKYTGIAISVSTTETLEAIAVATGYTNSAVATAAYTISAANSVLPTPTLSLATGNYTTAQTLTITDAASGATIYYTTNDTLPTTSSPKYTGPIKISSSEAVIAVAAAPGYTNSAWASGVYLINNVLPTPTILPAGGTYNTSQTVTIREWLNTDVYYTTNGTTPTTSSTRYTGPFTVNSTETIKAIVIASGYTNSAVATAAYTIQAATPSINLGAGFAASQGKMVLNGTAQLNGSGLQLTNGATSQEGSAWYATPVNIQSFTTNFTFQLTNPEANGITFTIQNQGTAALGIFGTGLGYQYIPTSVAVKFDLFNAGGEGPDSTGLYTDGAVPTVPAVNLSSTGINLHSGDTMAVQLVYNGTTLTMTITDTVTQATYTTSFTINIPSTVGGNTAYVGFTGGTGILSATQTILTWTYTN